MSPELMAFITANMSRISITVIACVVTTAVLNALVLAFLARERKSRVIERDAEGRTIREIQIVGDTSLGEFMARAKTTMQKTKPENGEF